MDFPRNLREFDRIFASKDACLLFLEQVRWGRGFRCQSCGASAYWKLGSGLRRCRSCRFKNSVKTGTIFESSRLPLKMWFYSIWWITAQRNGVSALDLQKDVGLGSYRSAWLLLHKIRAAMREAEPEPLREQVELYECSLDPARGERLWVLAEGSGRKKIGRIRIARATGGAEALRAFLHSNVQAGATIELAEALPELSRSGYRFQVRGRGTGFAPRAKLVMSQLRRWVKGTLHGRLEAKHLDAYLTEFCFRFNQRGRKARLFERVMENALQVPPAPYAALILRSGPAQGQSST